MSILQRIKNKAQLVVKGYSQIQRIDLERFFSLVAQLTSVRFILTISTIFYFEVYYMDVKTTFLHGDLEE